MGLSDVPASVEMDVVRNQRERVSLGRPEDPPRVSLGLQPSYFLDDLVVSSDHAQPFAGRCRHVAHEEDGDKVGVRLSRGHVPIQQQWTP